MAVARRPKPADPATKSKLNVKQNSSSKATNKPRCPIHHVEMEYVANEGLWLCQEPDCKKVAVPKDDVTGGNRPVIGRGEVEMFTAKDRHGQVRVCLRTPSNNVIIDITDLVSNVGLEQTFSGTTATMSMQVPYITTDGEEDPFEVDPRWCTNYIDSDGTRAYEKAKPQPVISLDPIVSGAILVSGAIIPGMIKPERIFGSNLTPGDLQRFLAKSDTQRGDGA